jgi:hypothetical protein
MERFQYEGFWVTALDLDQASYHRELTERVLLIFFQQQVIRGGVHILPRRVEAIQCVSWSAQRTLRLEGNWPPPPAPPARGGERGGTRSVGSGTYSGGSRVAAMECVPPLVPSLQPTPIMPKIEI